MMQTTICRAGTCRNWGHYGAASRCFMAGVHGFFCVWQKSAQRILGYGWKSPETGA
jgi:hypothetical protein